MPSHARQALRAPFPYFGGKSRAAELIWAELGDPGGYIEPFAGSAATLLGRPPYAGRRSEMLNDSDGWLVNAWRSIQLSPAATAAHAAGPTIELDYHARLAWLHERRTPDLTAWLAGDPEHHDPKAAGWWLYVMSCGLGDPWSGGPWRVIDGHLRRTDTPTQGIARSIPCVGVAFRGVQTHDDLGAYMAALAERLRWVRITCGDWSRVLTPSARHARTGGDGSIAILLDPPYATSGDLYAESASGISDDVRAWCASAPAICASCYADTTTSTTRYSTWAGASATADQAAATGTPPAPTTAAVNASGARPHA